MFSNTAEYALRAVAYLAAAADKPASSQTIAKHTKVPPGYLSKILNDLATVGIVNSKRGPRGGFTLAKPPESLSVLDVINAVDPFQRIVTCPLGIPSHGTHLCKLHRRLDDAIALVQQALGASTIAEMIDRTHEESFPLDDRPPVTPTVNRRPV